MGVCLWLEFAVRLELGTGVWGRRAKGPEDWWDGGSASLNGVVPFGGLPGGTSRLQNRGRSAPWGAGWALGSEQKGEERGWGGCVFYSGLLGARSQVRWVSGRKVPPPAVAQVCSWSLAQVWREGRFACVLIGS